MNTFQYKGRKVGETRIVPTAPFRFNDGGRQHSKRPMQRNDCTVRAIAIVCGFCLRPAQGQWQKMQSTTRSGRARFAASMAPGKLTPGAGQNEGF